MRKNRLSLRSVAMIVACLAVTVAFTSCGGSGGSTDSGGKGLSGIYVGYTWGTKLSITFSGNKFKIDKGKEVVQEGIFEVIEEYKEDDFSRGTIIFTYRDGKDKGNYILEGKKGEILTINDRDYNYEINYNGMFIKGGKSSKIPNGTYSNNDFKASFIFSGNNLIIDSNEFTYEFIVGYEDKGIRKGYILLRTENGDNTERCILEKDKLMLGDGYGNLLVLTKE